MSMHIFTYGTLMFEKIWLKVAGTKCKSSPAQISGFERTAVKNEVYPVLIPGEKDVNVDGIIYFEVSDYIIQKLDCFEGQAYNREEVAVTLKDGRKIPAQTYVLKNAFFSIIDNKTWDKQHFAEMYMSAFLAEDV